MRKTFLLAALVGVASSAIAEGLTTKLEGMFHFQSGFRKQAKIPAGADKNVSANRKNAALDTNSYIAAEASNSTDTMKYGARIVLRPTSNASGSTSYQGSHIFTECDYGKWELGSDFDAGTKMRITGYDIARGTGDNWTKYIWNAEGVAMAPVPGYYLNDFKDISVESSKKITYFTPEWNSVQLGVSYIPDTSNVGNGGISHSYNDIRFVEDVNTSYNYYEKLVAKDAFGAGVTFAHKLGDDVDLKIAATGETGAAASKGKKTSRTNPANVTEYKVANMQTYNIGAILNYSSFSYGASYGEAKGFTSRELDASKRRSRFYSAAAAYNQGPVGLSLSYVLGDHRKNKMDAFTIGTDYKLAPGLVPYAEVTCFKGKGQKLPIYNNNTISKFKGTVVLLGAKLKF
jgi:hypothetical protein